MNIFIDCEFNEFKGGLISMALVTHTGAEFYEVLECESPKQWVRDNVLPVLNKEPVDFEVFQTKLQRFLAQFEEIHIIADWPEDIKYFCDSLITGPGMKMNTPPLKFSVYDWVGMDTESVIPHNALEDARSNHDSFLNKRIMEGRNES